MVLGFAENLRNDLNSFMEAYFFFMLHVIKDKIYFQIRLFSFLWFDWTWL